MTQTDKGQFVQFPIHLIYGCPDLNRDDKWVLLSIMGVCWAEDPQRLSYRDIAAISGVPLSLISSFKDKTGKVHEGIVDRLVRLNYVRIIVGKEVNHSTGSVKGNAQSYLFVNYSHIWRMNVAYCQKKTVQEEFKVGENDYQPVSNTNRCVSNTNTSVPIENEPVSYTNEPVSVASTKTGTYITVDTIDPTDNIDKEKVADATAPAKTSSQENDLEKTEKRRATPSPKKEVVHTHGFSPDAHIDSVVDHHFPADHLQSSSPPRTDNMVTEPTATRKRAANKGILPKHITQQGLVDEIPSLPASKPVEPLADMAWGTRKCLQWFDYWRGGTLIAKYKIQQAASCAKGLAEQFDEATVIQVRGDMADDPYYIERGGPDICDVANNIHKYLNKKKPKKEPSNEHKAAGFYSNGAIFERNKAKTEAKIAEALAWDEARRAREVQS